MEKDFFALSAKFDQRAYLRSITILHDGRYLVTMGLYRRDNPCDNLDFTGSGIHSELQTATNIAVENALEKRNSFDKRELGGLSKERATEEIKKKDLKEIF